MASKELKQLRPPDLAPQRYCAQRIDAVDLEHRLGEIQTYRNHLTHALLLFSRSYAPAGGGEPSTTSIADIEWLANAAQMTPQLGIAFVLICAGCTAVSAGQEYFGQATPLCSIADDQTYAGRQILVSAMLIQTPHGRELYSPECERAAALNSSSDTWDSHAKSVIDQQFADNKTAQVPVVVSGVFQPSTRNENGTPIITVGGPVIDHARIVAARSH